MNTISEEVAVLEQQQGWDRLFREIKVVSAKFDLSCKIAKLPENRNKNRYRDVSPYDHTRVKLIQGPSDYINSSLIKMDEADRRYILTQGPLLETSGEFWQMVWEQNSKAIIMLNKVMEKGTSKCHQYWPLDRNRHLSYPVAGFEVALAKESVKQSFVIREFKLTNLNLKEERIIIHFHYIAWPDFGVPESPTSFLDFLTCVRSHGVLSNKHGPAVIHCSAGIGRSGTFALVDTCLEYLEKGIRFSIRETLLEMRKCRMGLIQTPHQLRFSYFAIAQCEKELRFKQHNSDKKEKSDSETDNDDFSPQNHDAGDSHKDSDQTDHDNDKNRENRKRHGDQNGPEYEKRGKVEEADSLEPLVLKCPVPAGCEDDAQNSFQSNNGTNKLRNRQVSRTDKSIALAKKVKEIKENMKKNEKGWPWKRYVAGGVLASIVIGFAICHWYYSQ